MNGKNPFRILSEAEMKAETTKNGRYIRAGGCPDGGLSISCPNGSDVAYCSGSDSCGYIIDYTNDVMTTIGVICGGVAHYCSGCSSGSSDCMSGSGKYKGKEGTLIDGNKL